MQRLSAKTWLWIGLVIAVGHSLSAAAEPRVLIENAKLERIAAEPDIVTPVGMAFDSVGRLLVIESHTHQRPDGYEGPAGDRIRLLSDSNGDGKLDQWSTFAEGFQQSMNLLTAGPGRVYLVTRRSVDLLIDEDLDGRVDRQESVLRLETDVNYPHNALSGIALDGQGGLYVGLGENFGAPYKLVGADGSSYSDRGGAGTIFHCTADGKKLRRFCNGFWNPFSICVLPGGPVFTVDNDPDSSPPCRLIHAVESGDYGHRWEYSRKGTHPLQAWNGELPGTLPMLAGTGEAPCAVLPHRGYLWVTSWGDHRLERYQLESKGASYDVEQTIAVQGDTNFRPTGCAIAPDGSLYFSDWVDASYPVHGQGRIWRLVFADEATNRFPADKPLAQAARHPLKSRGFFARCLESQDLFCRQSAVRTWLQANELWGEELDNEDANATLVRLQALRWASPEPATAEAVLRDSLRHQDVAIRLYAIRWIADERIQSLRNDVEALLDGDVPNQQYYLAALGALEWLDGDREVRSTTLNDGLLVRELKNKRRSPELHAMALRLTSPDNQYLTLDKLRQYLQAEYRPIRLEAIRTLALQNNPERFQLLAEVAQDTQQSEQVRAEAIAGLAASDQHTELLAGIANDDIETLRQEARRVQRLTGQLPVDHTTKPAATDLEAWNELLANPGDAAAGRRLFFSSRGARCGICHQHSGRGGKIGPDLTRIARSNSRQQIIAAILQPSSEMAPHYVPWVLQTTAGKTQVALRLHKSGDGGKEVYADAEGNSFGLHGNEIELRQASDTSIMPSGLEKTVSIDQLRDLVEFLSDMPSALR
ncbi:MAG: PVC-type heme-binding CxxCH protein [Bythopirellula sp.]